MYLLKPLFNESRCQQVSDPTFKVGQPYNIYEQEAKTVDDGTERMHVSNQMQMLPIKDEIDEELIRPIQETEVLPPHKSELQTEAFNISMLPQSENNKIESLMSPVSAKNRIVQKSDIFIQRVPMPAESAVNTLADYAEGARQGIRFDSGFDWQSVLSHYFVRGIVMDVRSGYNVTFVARGFPTGEEWVSNALKALVLFNFNLNSGATDAPVLNITSVQHLDLSRFISPADTTVHGPDAIFRFTSTRFDPTVSGDVRTENVQLLVEKLGNFTAAAAPTETAEERRRRFENTYHITNAVPVRHDPLGDPIEAMSDSQFDQVLDGLNQIPANILSRVPGIPIHLGLSARGSQGEMAEYRQTRPAGSTVWERKITVYSDFFGLDAKQKAFTMIHEIGHALDYRPNEASGGRGGPSASAATGRDSFRHAVQQDGGLRRGVSTYAATTSDFDEYYAEAFAMFRSQPDTLKAIRPNVYQYFVTQFP